MKFFKRRPVVDRPVPEFIEGASGDAHEDMSRAVQLHQEALAQEAAAHDVVAGLARSRIRNGFAPAIEQSIINKYLGGAT